MSILSSYLRSVADGQKPVPPDEVREAQRKHGFLGKLPKAIAMSLLAAFAIGLSTPTPALAKDAMSIAAKNAGSVKVTLSAECKENISQIRAKLKDTELAAVAATGSMAPTFDENYIVVLQKTKFDDMKEGDVALRQYVGSKSAIMHRLERKEGTQFPSRGDAARLSGGPEDSTMMSRANFLDRRVVAAVHKTDGHVVWLNPKTVSMELEAKPAAVPAVVAVDDAAAGHAKDESLSMHKVPEVKVQEPAKQISAQPVAMSPST